MYLILSKVSGPQTTTIFFALVAHFCSIAANLTDDIENALTKHNTFRAIIPGGTTSRLQPCDQVLNKKFKSLMRKEWEVRWRALTCSLLKCARVALCAELACEAEHASQREGRSEVSLATGHLQLCCGRLGRHHYGRRHCVLQESRVVREARRSFSTTIRPARTGHRGDLRSA